MALLDPLFPGGKKATVFLLVRLDRDKLKVLLHLYFCILCGGLEGTERFEMARFQSDLFQTELDQVGKTDSTKPRQLQKQKL